MPASKSEVVLPFLAEVGIHNLFAYRTTPCGAKPDIFAAQNLTPKPSPATLNASTAREGLLRVTNTATYQDVAAPAASSTGGGAATSLSGTSAFADIINTLLQIAATGGGNFATLGGGVLVGTNDSNGASLAYVGPGVLRAMDGALANPGTLQASKFLSCVADGSVEWGNLAANTGLGVNSGATTLQLITNGIAALSISASQGVSLASTLSVTGATTLAGVTAAATSVSTLATSGLATLASAAVTANATVGGTLGVTGSTTLAGLTAGASSVSTLSTSGLATLASASVTGTLGVTGNTTLAGLTAGASSVSTLSTSGLATLSSAAVTNALTVGTTLGVTGATTLAGLTAGASSVSTLSTSGLATLSSASITNNATVGGTLTSTGQIIGGLGSATAPSHTILGQLGSGMYWDSTHAGLGLASGGAEVMYFSGGGAYTTGPLSIGGNMVANGYISGTSGGCNIFIQSYTKGITLRQNNVSANTSGLYYSAGLRRYASDWGLHPPFLWLNKQRLSFRH